MTVQKTTTKKIVKKPKAKVVNKTHVTKNTDNKPVTKKTVAAKSIVKKDVDKVVETVKPLKKVLTGEGWRRMGVRKKAKA